MCYLFIWYEYVDYSFVHEIFGNITNQSSSRFAVMRAAERSFHERKSVAMLCVVAVQLSEGQMTRKKSKSDVC